MTYDVTIVGAGPSGSYAAYLLAKTGFRVLILDKAEFPRDKVCGGGLSNKTLQLVEFDLEAVVQARVRGAYLTYQNRGVIARDLQGREGVSTVRRDFDELILQKAVAHGATFRPRCSFLTATASAHAVTAVTSDGSFTSRYLFGADGVFSQVRARLFPSRLVAYAAAVEALVYVEPSVVERFDSRVVFDLGALPHGYGWIFPKRDHLNVGVFSIYPTTEIKAALGSFMARYRTLREAREIRHLGSCIPIRNTRKLYQLDNVWLLGDAAGFAEDVYGEGIYFALKSAVVAARALQEAFANPRSKRYTEEVRAELASELAYSELNARLLFAFPQFAFNRMVRSDVVSRNFGELIGGRVSHRACFYRTLATAPYWLLAGRRQVDRSVEL